MTIERYNARETEARWQKIWDQRGIGAILFSMRLHN